MDTVIVFVIFFIGLLTIVKGGDLFVDAAIWMAKKTGIPSMVIGATIVSIATTLPEFFVSTVASNEGHSDIAIGNVIGSIICNIAFVIGLCSCIKPIKIKKGLFNVKGFMMIGYLIIFYIFARNGIVTFKEGFILLALFLFFIIINILEFKVRGENTEKIKKESVHSKKDIILNIVKFILGAWFIVIGAHMLVDSGVKIARIFKIPQQVVSLTLLAVGTSLPELVTSVAAVIKDEENISVGNIIGANILNLTIVLGSSALVSDNGLFISDQTLYLDIPIALLVMTIFVFSGAIKKEIDRKSGLLFLTIYIVYLIILF
ncbi:calcium/sodium antiporter [Anaerosalibacter bizertensis]|uniref:Calcium/sodium antiporter n=1 Tax=Anaerosalibacter bizertensis TaxID=932217 RepID=A0A9Q4ACF3_9FIRM|nr:calcium/sodium antiporter [Anaerosalibacter bizertensis]MBV1817278.1 calcium/sodium antiporter [Bacteroidales bacterium MSK.15.36]MCB5559964.1 calcium/sodium antiporter [Anaerosalibacter bizertensis]MCG4565333.1 calcium/sodium antiporter [Anaerosalibacter bizertensis]MCG4582440.1 calcium/sodium antiporter [Anaerosalibacter bizertensis]